MVDFQNHRGIAGGGSATGDAFEVVAAHDREAVLDRRFTASAIGVDDDRSSPRGFESRRGESQLPQSKMSLDCAEVVSPKTLVLPVLQRMGFQLRCYALKVLE